MNITLHGAHTHVARGGKAFIDGQSTVVFAHGSGMDHRCFALQTRWFAWHGYNVVAPDLPGHSLSSGKPLETIVAMAEWLGDLLEALHIRQAHLVGHSQGFLYALELARVRPEQVASLSGIACADRIEVNPALIEMAENDVDQAVAMMLQWGFGRSIQMGLSPVPGMQPLAQAARIMESNPLAADLNACANYLDGSEAVGQIECPLNMILAERDRMTPASLGEEVARKSTRGHYTTIAACGHMLPIEAPRQTLQALRKLIAQAR